MWQYQELFPATTMNDIDSFQNGGPFGMADPNQKNVQAFEMTAYLKLAQGRAQKKIAGMGPNWK